MSASTPQPGRPRSETARRDILNAAFILLAERGYDLMTIEAVARRARVSKVTIYKWWPERPALAVEAFFENTKSELSFEHTSDARADFRNQIRALCALLRSTPGKAFAAMITGARGDATLRQAISDRWISPRRHWGVARLQRAVDEGQCVEDLDIGAALAILYSLVYAPLLLGVGVPAGDRLDACLDIAFAGIFKAGGV